MGRPSLDIIATVVRLTRESIAEIDRIAGANRRAKFIRDAVAEKLKRELSRRTRKAAKKEGGDNGD